MFENRQQAGQLLTEKLKSLGIAKSSKDLVVLAIPRGGLVVGKEISLELSTSLDIIVVKKLGAPNQSELAIGAVGETPGSTYLDKKLVSQLRVSSKYIEEIKKLRNLEIKRREKLYRQGKPALNLQGKIVIITDDGAATGATMIAACREVWNNNPKKVIVALPVLARDTLKKLEEEADEVVYLEAPRMFFSVGQFYEEFDQVTDQTVIKILSLPAGRQEIEKLRE